jgi:dTDP-4-dehydrorhamnose 3,5-epimerase
MDSLSTRWRHNILESKIVLDERGLLGEFTLQQIEFKVKRIYWVYSKLNQNRGFHAHKELYQFLVVLEGRIKIMLDDAQSSQEFLLAPGENLLIRPGVWREFVAHDGDATILVLASEEYRESDYIRDYDEFVRWDNEVF